MKENDPKYLTGCSTLAQYVIVRHVYFIRVEYKVCVQNVPFPHLQHLNMMTPYLAHPHLCQMSCEQHSSLYEAAAAVSNHLCTTDTITPFGWMTCA